ncbi:serine-protein kinase ATM-like [Antedon mediterranea]|uniref:serine-protein kinase ATM-like n=1 Tax=Antedon mediterranea TaxID=105859 RepID=UPI003AF79B2D
MSELSRLRSACLQLGDAKITQKKQGLETLKEELMKDKVQRSLDEATDKKHELNWNKLFEFIQNYISDEAKLIQKSKSGTASTARSQQTRKKNVGSTFKWIIKVANGRGERIKCDAILQYIFSIFSDDFLRSAIGEDAISVLCKNVLRSQKYVTELKQKEWNDLIKLCTNVYMNQDSRINKTSLSQAINVLITEAVNQCEINHKRLYKFFLEVLPHIKNEKTTSLRSSIVASLNKFSCHMMTNYRRQLCNIGEHVLPVILHFWNRSPEPHFKNHMIEFMQIQMTVHHPLGAASEQQGAYANDQDTWKMLIKSLYKAVYEDIRQTSNKAKLKNTSAKVFYLDENLTDLATDVFYQMFTSHSDYVCEMTQDFSATQSTAPKRRRIVCGWKVLSDNLSEQASTLQGIAWLQVLNAILRKYPSSLPKEDLTVFLNTLLQARVQCKRSEVQTLLLQCLSALAVSQKSIKIRQSLADRLKPLWNKVWSTASSAVRSISPNDTQYQAYDLLCTLLTYDLVTVDKDQWRLFIPGITQPTSVSVRCLAICLQKTTIPENYQSLGQSFSDSPFPLRCQLLQWLISVQDSDDDGSSDLLQTTLTRLIQFILIFTPSNRVYFMRSLSVYVSPALFAKVLVSLVEQTPTIETTSHTKPSRNYLDDAAQSYLTSGFILKKEKETKEVTRPREMDGTKRIYEEVLEMMIERLDEATNQVIHAAVVQDKAVEYVLLLAVVIQKVLMQLLKGQMLTFDKLSDCKLCKQFKKLLQNAWECLLRICKKKDLPIDTQIEFVFSVLSRWSPLFSLEEEETEMPTDVVNAVTEISRDAVPAAFIKHLFKITNNEILNPLKQRSPLGDVEYDPFDDAMDIDLPDSSESFDDGFGDIESVKKVQVEDSIQVKDRPSIVSNQSLLPRQQLSLKCLHLLTSYSCLRSFNPDVLSGTSSNVMQKLLTHLNDEDKSTSFGLQSCFCIIEIYSSSCIRLSGSTADILLKTLREMASKQRKNHKVCAKILKQIQLLLSHLANDGNSPDDMDDAKTLAVELLCIFRRINENNMYTPAVRMEIAKCVKTLIQLDPEGNWSVWQKSLGNNTDNTYKSVIADFPEFLLDSDHQIQMLLAEGVRYLFQFPGETATWRMFSKDIQNSAFDLIYQKAQEAMPKQEPGARDSSDEFVNRSSALLHTLATIAKSSIVCQKKSVFALTQTVKLNGITTSHISRVVHSISSSLSYPSSLAFLQSHLGFLISQWLDVGYHIFEFPYQLIDCRTKAEFFTKYHRTIIPYLVMYRDNFDHVDKIAKEIGMTTQQLIQEDFPQCIVHILPLFAHVQEDEANNMSHVEKKAQATASFKLLEEILGKREIDQLIQSNLDTIVVELLLMLYDPDLTSSSGCSPEPNPPYLLAYTIQATLDYLTACHGNSQKTLISLLSRSPDSIQNILLNLQVKLQQSHCHYEKQRLLTCYRFFVTLLLKELDTGLGGAWAFVLHDTIHTLLQIISGCQDDSSCLLAVSVIHHICQVALGCYHKELGKLAVSIVRVLVPLAKQDRNLNLSNQAVLVVNLLVVEGSKKISDSLQYVDPLPDVPCLNAARRSLDVAKYMGSKFNLLEEINHFLVCDGQNNNVPSLECLQLLHQKLSKCRDEMKLLLTDNLESIGNLIASLVSVCRRSGNQDNAIKQQAACCLGEIGPVDLSTVSLKSHQSEENKSYATAVEVYVDEPHMVRKCTIIHLLKSYLTDACVETKQAAVECLKCLLATPSGIAFRDDYVDRNIDQLFVYLHPFRPNKKRKTKLSQQAKNDQDFKDTLNYASLWQPESTSHEDWIRQLSCALIDSGAIQDEFLQLVKPVCKVKVEFAEQVLGYLIHDILTSENDVYRQILSNHIQSFFARHCGDNSSDRAPTPMSIDMFSQPKSKHSTSVMLQVVHYLRTQKRPSTRNAINTAWDNNFWLDLDYLVVAMAAKTCSAHFTCMLYTEIWCDQQKNGSGQTSGIEVLSSLSGDHGINVQQLLLDSYRNIGEPDGIYGYGAGRLTDTSARIHTYEHEGKWMKSLSAYDCHLQQDPTAPVSGILQGLKNVGLNHVMDTYLKHCCETSERSEEVSEAQYESAWRLGQWDLQICNTSSQANIGFHEGIYKALTAMKNKDDRAFKVNIDKAKGQVIDDLCHVSLESNQNVYPLLCQVQMLMEVQHSMLCIQNASSDAITESWKEANTTQDLEFEFVEPILAIRSSILDIASDLTPRSTTIQDVMSEHLWSQSKLARKAERYHIAERAIMQLSKLNGLRDVGDTRKWVWQLEMAKMFWGRGECDTAKHLLRNFICQVAKTPKQTEVFRLIYPQSLGIYGQWLADTHTASPNTIMDDYLEKAVNIYDVTNNTSGPAIQAYLSLARFADTHYQNISTYMKSKVFEDKKALLSKCRADLECLEAMGHQPTKYQRTLEKQKEIDETEVAAMEDDKSNYLHKAVNWYLTCLMSSDENDIRTFRVCSLWFDNANDPDVNHAIETALTKLESRKFLPLMYQLAARMTTKVNGKVKFHQVLLDVIRKTVVDHPHHTLPVILALANANRDTQLSNKRSASRKGDAGQNVEERMVAAQNLLEDLKSSSDCCVVIKSLNTLSLSYIKLAYHDVMMYKRETKPIKIPSNQPLVQIKDLEHVAVPTLDLPVDPSCNYDDIVYVKDFKPTFKLAGGVNLPKILTCVGSNGREYTQLVKGRDDLRQDAVMQQVFGLVNSLLLKNPETRKRKLHVRTYKVIPLSQRSGLLEWCAGTMPLGLYLTGNTKPLTGAHKRYRPTDLTTLECRKKMSVCNNAHDKAQKYTTFLQVMKNFRPVFRYFFMENFVDPTCWFERRLAYTRSVATSSIVGYIVGLGDRHVQNILIDCNTAELIHIDLGVAFEQGKILMTPETVPFRLTRDIEDGMGVAGVEGVFRRCCEKTMEVMHNSCEALLTILEVLLYDPLSDWTISSLKARNIQQDPDTSLTGTLDYNDNANVGGSSTKEVNKMAKRVLLRLRQKLQGEEDGVVLSVSGQVSRLIQEARDVKNLAGLFPGWQPWL